MSSDREMLELAAKAAGHRVNARMQAERDALGYGDAGLWIDGVSTCWNPLTDADHALRLAVTLRMRLTLPKYKGFGTSAEPQADGSVGVTSFREDPVAQTLEAIVRAAAEIGRLMP